MKRYHVAIQLCAQGIWREYHHEGQAYVFRLRRDAEKCAEELRKIYANPTRWNVSVIRRTVK